MLDSGYQENFYCPGKSRFDDNLNWGTPRLAQPLMLRARSMACHRLCSGI